MQKKDYKAYFDKIDTELLKISPRKDIMLLRVIATIIPVACTLPISKIHLLSHFSR